ncbi:hypothetical protein MJO28_017168 [Puccinia striiformis f. sp. tritici]|nr:hypothetical protein MJO28_017168 [Puccinia striiformis f. sp. tritici]
MTPDHGPGESAAGPPLKWLMLRSPLIWAPGQDIKRTPPPATGSGQSSSGQRVQRSVLAISGRIPNPGMVISRVIILRPAIE